jgi:hypothetical protein
MQLLQVADRPADRVVALVLIDRSEDVEGPAGSFPGPEVVIAATEQR